MDGAARQARLVPHRGLVVLEHGPISRRWYVIHRLTLERHELPLASQGWWRLSFDDDDDFGVVSDGHTVLYLEDCFAEAVYELDGKRVLLQHDANGELFPPLDLADLGHSHSLCEVQVWFASRREWCSFEGVVFEVARCPGNKIFWNLSALFFGLRLNFDCRPSDWVHKRWARFSKFLHDVVRIDSPLLKSLPLGGQLAPVDDDSSRSLRFPAAGSIVVVGLLAKLTFLPRSQGGLHSDDDKARVFELLVALLTCCLGIQAPPDFRGNLSVAKALGDAEEVAAVLDDSRKRQRLWLQRDPSMAWRPRKKFRTSSFELMLCLENQLRVSVGKEFRDFVQSGPVPNRPPPDKWPLLLLARDSGPDNSCACQFLARQMSVNLDAIPDVSHCIWRDIIQALKDSSCWLFMLLMMLCWNIPHGPWSEQTRWKQSCQAVEEKLATESASSDVLFQSLSFAMLADQNDEDTAGDPGVMARLWEEFRTAKIWRRKGVRCNVSRFLGALRQAREEQRFWHMRLLAYLYTSIELDFLRGKKFEQLMIKPLADEPSDPAVAPQAPMRAEGPDERVLRASCQNSMVIGVMLLSDETNQHKTRAILCITEVWEAWHTEQNHRLRSVGESVPWVQEQVERKFWEALNRTVAPLRDEGLLRWVGFRCSFRASMRKELGDNQHAAELQSELAHKMGSFALHLLFNRMRRHMFMLRGWPVRCALFLPQAGAGSSQSQQHIDAMRKDYANFVELKRSNHPMARKLCARSCFQLVCVDQVVQLMLETNWTMNDRVTQFIQARSLRAMGTQVVEDAFKRQARKQDLNPAHVCRQEQVFAILIQKHVLGQVHRYDEVRPQPKNLHRNARLLDSCYVPPASQSLPLRSIVGYNSTPTWYSAGPQQHHVIYSDLALTDWALTTGRVDRLQYLWKASLLQGDSLLVRERKVPLGDWLFVVGNSPGTASLGWPAASVAVPGVGQVFWPSTDVRPGEWCWIMLVDEDEWEAMCYRWVSPWEFWQSWPHAGSRLGLCVVPTGPSQPILRLAASNAFWLLPKTSLDAWCKELAIDLPLGADLFSTLWKLAEHILQPISDADIMEILMGRLASMSRHTRPGTEELMQLDDGNKLLTKGEADELKDERKAIESERQSAKSFAKRWREKKATMPAAKAGAGRGRGKGARGSRGGGGAAANRYLAEVPSGDFSQAQVRRLTPEGGSIWIGNSRGTWSGHYPPFQRCSAMWAHHGQRGACLFVLRILWRQHIVVHGLRPSDCPINGMLRGDEDPLNFLDAPPTSASSGSRE